MSISDFIRSTKTERPERKKKIHRALVQRRSKDGAVSLMESASSAPGSVKKVYVLNPPLINKPIRGAAYVVRLSDPDLAGEVQKLSEQIKSDPKFAMRLLRKAGIATPSGKLSQRYGG